MRHRLQSNAGEIIKKRKQKLKDIIKMTKSNILLEDANGTYVINNPKTLSTKIYGMSSCIDIDEDICDVNISTELYLYSLLFKDIDLHYIYYYKVINCITYFLRYTFYSYIEYSYEKNPKRRDEIANIINEELKYNEYLIALIYVYYEYINLKYPKNIISYKIFNSIKNIANEFLSNNRFIKDLKMNDINNTPITFHAIINRFGNIFKNFLANKCALMISTKDGPCIKSTFSKSTQHIKDIFSSSVPDKCIKQIQSLIQTIKVDYNNDKHSKHLILNLRSLDDHFKKAKDDKDIIEYEPIDVSNDLIF